MQFTQNQLILLGYVITLLPPLVQGLRWVFMKIGKPLEGNLGPRILTGICAVGLLLLFSVPVFPAFPGFLFTVEGMIGLLGWVEASVSIIGGLVFTGHLLYEYIYRRAFDKTALASAKVG